MAPLAAAIPPNVELVYVDAPSLSEGDFGWWHEGFTGWERTRDWAVELLRSGPRVLLTRRPRGHSRSMDFGLDRPASGSPPEILAQRSFFTLCAYLQR